MAGCPRPIPLLTPLCAPATWPRPPPCAVLASFTASQPSSPQAANLKACAAFRLYHGKAGEAELRALADAGVPLDRCVPWHGWW